MVVVTEFSDVSIKPSTFARFDSNKHRSGRWRDRRVSKALVRVVQRASLYEWKRGRVLTEL
jgi:hypothetical protein